MMPDVLDSKKVFSVLEELTSLPGPSGQEEAVRAWLRGRWQQQTSEWIEDPVGNVMCRVGGTGKKLLIQAHMDEIGFVVRYITLSGFLLLDTSQGSRLLSPERRYMIGQHAQVIGRFGVVTTGVFAAPSGHVLTRDQLSKHEISIDDFYLDIGAKDRSEVEALGVYIGAGVIWSTPLRWYNGRIVGKAMDDRMLLGVMDLLLTVLDKEKLCYNLWYGATVQEENGMHGGLALASTTNFDLSIALDVGPTGDTPLVSEQEYPFALSKGPILVHKDEYVHYDKGILWRLADVAQEHALPFQHGVFNRYGSDGEALLNSGVPSSLIAVATRYTHTAFEMVDPIDILTTVRLLHHFLTTSVFPLL